ncbi:MAG: D-amino-acid transaminase [Verrucomicrobiaceae bacterium]|nr:D-amino-acid transaminase [Verrucomicrobiaceae bacterium]
MTTVYLNGQYLPAEHAQISVMDRGFLFGDGVYEVIPVFGGRCFRLDEHLDRLDYSLRETAIAQPLTRAQWLEIFEHLIAAYGGGDQAIYIQITRGIAATREFKFPEQTVPTVFAMSRVLAPAPEEAPAPIAVITVDDIRWQRCDIKSTSLLAGVLMTQQALHAGAREAILLRDGVVLEGASSNVFAVTDGVLYTAAKDHRILAGITRDLIVELVQQKGLEFREQALPTAQLSSASEVWISSSTREMVAVTQLDGKAVGSGEIGPVYRQVWQWYREYRKSFSR